VLHEHIRWCSWKTVVKVGDSPGGTRPDGVLHGFRTGSMAHRWGPRFELQATPARLPAVALEAE
jgi:hypothetical protein